MQNKEYKKLFTKLKLKNFLLKNRFVLSPITLNVSTKNGIATKKDYDYALKRAHSAPLAITTAANINKEGRLFEFSLAADRTKNISSLSKLALAMKNKGAKAILQLTHSGRYSIATQKKLNYVVGPSEKKLNFPIQHTVKELKIREIKKIIRDYEKATLVAIKAGFDGIEISSAQKLLLQTFFSKNENQRTDLYGTQNLLNRSRISLEVFRAVQKVIKENADDNFILGYRATPEEIVGQDVGYNFDEFLEFMTLLLKEVQIDYLALASWGKKIYLSKVRTFSKKYYGMLWTEAIKKHFKNKINLMINGGISSYEDCIEAIKHADLIGLSSVFIVEPDFVNKIKNQQLDKINLKISKKDLKKLAIPKKAFKKIEIMLDYSASIPEVTRDFFKKNNK
ncbi:oxidoreductase [Mesomycoplasma neurolyticum]|uniref:NADH:flavin oxidoreductase/NADH oxidase family protein n=1 Tax=Mesomycoplasma neurolyticum TaxID=2120 RepID=A0A449A5L4_9BACT|nr:NADH-dependent flavin oxidoreductase [Mesomycoplasma neurolyticum]VEU59517.1 NADH:flavin oxidoreductase/NADH oxidase family protein [Mesomycoplasma neurolyticum]